MASNISREEKRRLINERQSAVRKAWKEEQQRVSNGKGTRDWNSDEQKELIERGSVRGYEGHHMKSVKDYPQEAGNPKNIQFLSDDEHFNGAHQGNYQNSTNGYYDPETQTMYAFDGDELIEIPDRDLSNPCYIDGVEQTTAQKQDVNMSEEFYVDDSKEQFGDTSNELPEDSKVFKRDEFEILSSGNDAINQRLEVQADDYRDKGMSEDEIQDRLASDKWNYQQEYLNDAFPNEDVSPNVFNGFSENGSRDRMTDIEQSETLRNQLGTEESSFDEDKLDFVEENDDIINESFDNERNEYINENSYDESLYDESTGDSLSEDRNSYSEDNLDFVEENDDITNESFDNERNEYINENSYDESLYDESTGDSLSEDRNSYLEDNDETLDINEASDEYSQSSISDESASYSDDMSDSNGGETETSSEGMSSSSGVDSGSGSSSSSESSSCSSESSGMGM